MAFPMTPSPTENHSAVRSINYRAPAHFQLRFGYDFRSGRTKAKRFIVQETGMDAILRIGRQTSV
jgi:hypothetical protein